MFGPNDPGYSVDTMRKFFARGGEVHHQHDASPTRNSGIIDALLSGIRAAKLAYLGEGMAGRAADTAKLVAFGQAPNAFVEGARTFSPGGALHWKNVLWPTMPGRPVMQTLGRAGTLLTAAALPSMMRQDAHEGGLSRLLGGVGGLAGMMYGGSAGGMIGTPLGMTLGRGIGHGIGHLLGSRPRSDYP
jgi:hypothetical protein